MHPDSTPTVAMRWTPPGKRKRKTESNFETFHRKGNERQRLNMEKSTALVSRQTTLEIAGDGIMCKPARI